MSLGIVGNNPFMNIGGSGLPPQNGNNPANNSPWNSIISGATQGGLAGGGINGMLTGALNSHPYGQAATMLAGMLGYDTANLFTSCNRSWYDPHDVEADQKAIQELVSTFYARIDSTTDLQQKGKLITELELLLNAVEWNSRNKSAKQWSSKCTNDRLKDIHNWSSQLLQNFKSRLLPELVKNFEVSQGAALSYQSDDLMNYMRTAVEQSAYDTGPNKVFSIPQYVLTRKSIGDKIQDGVNSIRDGQLTDITDNPDSYKPTTKFGFIGWIGLLIGAILLTTTIVKNKDKK